MQFNPIIEVETKIVQKEGFLPDEITVVRSETMPLQQMGFYNSLRNTRNRYAKKRSPSYRDFSNTFGGDE